jgi:hypothetical protein
MTSIWSNAHSQSAYDAAEAARFGMSVPAYLAMEKADELKRELNGAIDALASLMGEEEAITWYNANESIPSAWSWNETEVRPIINIVKARAVLITDARAMVERTGQELDLAIEKAQAGSIHTDDLEEFQTAYDAATDRLHELMNGRGS